MESSIRNTRLLYAFWFLRDFQLWIPVWIIFLVLEQGFTLTEITFAEGLYLVGVVLLEVPTGAVADKWGRSRSLGLGAFTLAGAVLVFAFATNYAILLVSFFMWSLATTLMSGADRALLFETLKASGEEAKYERIAGRGLACTYVGIGVATLLGGPVAAVLSTEATIYIGAATCVVTGFVAFAMKEAPHTSTGNVQAQNYLVSIRDAFREVWNDSTIRPLVLLSGAVLAGMESVTYLIQPYLLDRGIEVGTLFSVLQVPMFLAGLVGALLVGRITSASASTRALLLFPIAGSACCVALAATPGLGAYAAYPLIMAIASAVEPLASGIINRAASSERRATILSISGMMRSLVMAVAAPGVGYLTDTYGLGAAFSGSAFVIGIALVVFGAPVFARRKTIAPAEVAPA